MQPLAMQRYGADFQRVVWSRGPFGDVKVVAAPAPDFFLIIPTVDSCELWAAPTVADLTNTLDLSPDTVRFPHPGETIIRLIEFSAPESAASSASEEEALNVMLEDAGDGQTRGHLHRTQTTDYFMVLSGEVALLAEGEEVVLRAGDTAVCLGALHAWVVRTPEPARVLTVLVGASGHGDESPTAFTEVAATPAPDDATVRRVVLGHDVDGGARILADGPVALPGRLWSSDDATPDNATADRLLVPAPALPASGTGFEVHVVAPGSSLTVAGERHLVAGGVVEGTLTANVPGSSETVILGCGDTFIAQGTPVTWTNDSKTPARMSLVSLPGVGA